MDCIELWTPFVLKLHAFILKVIEELQTAPVNNEEKELLQLLSTPHLRVKKTHQNTPENLLKFLCITPTAFCAGKVTLDSPKRKQKPLAPNTDFFSYYI